MARVVREGIGNGTWLGVEHEGSRVIGAHFQVDVSPDMLLTIMWTGLPNPEDLVGFCQVLSPTLGVAGSIRRRGRVFASEGVATYEDQRWLEAAAAPGARFVRLEFGLAATGHEGHTVILWARLDACRPEGEAADCEDENVGVQLALAHVSNLEHPLATLIASSMPGGPGFDVVLLAIRTLAEYLVPRPTGFRKIL